MLPRLAFVVLLLAVAAAGDDAGATPKQIVILRHGEKQDAYRLCSIGVQRSLALAGRYLGKGADNSLFFGRKGPDAFLAITLHTLELVSPAAQSWGMPVTLYSALPMHGQSEADLTQVLNRRTQEAARNLIGNPQWNGKTVVMVWEHHHIADSKLEKQFPGQMVTLRQLLGLDTVEDVPATWPGHNFDYFWIVDYAPGSDRPTRFQARKQVFAAPYDKVPSNDWGQRPVYPPKSGCLK
jgi:hypothetical protein